MKRRVVRPTPHIAPWYMVVWRACTKKFLLFFGIMYLLFSLFRYTLFWGVFTGLRPES